MSQAVVQSAVGNWGDVSAVVRKNLPATVAGNALDVRFGAYTTVGACSVVARTLVPLFSDAFTRADENPLAGNWTTQPGGFGALKLKSNQVNSAPGGLTTCAAYVNSVSPAANQYVQCTVGTIADGLNGEIGLACRMSTTENSFYYLYVVRIGGVYSLGLAQYDAGVVSNLASNSLSHTPGDTYRFEVTGTGGSTRCKGYQNGTLLLDQPGGIASGHDSGRCGLYAFGNDTDSSADNFVCGSIVLENMQQAITKVSTDINARSRTSIFYAENITGGDVEVETTTTAGAGNRYGWVWAGEISGRATSGSLDVTGDGTSNSSDTPTAVASGAIAQAGCMIVAAVFPNAGNPAGIDPIAGNSLSWTNRYFNDDNNTEMSCSYDDAIPSSVITPSVNWGTLASICIWTAVIAVFKDAPSGGVSLFYVKA